MGKSKASSHDDSPAREVAELLRALLHAFLSESSPAWIGLELTLPQLRAVFVVAHNKASSIAQIAQAIGVGEPTASHLVSRLVRADLVDRREDSADRRRVIVRLSKAGEELIEKLLGWEKLFGQWLHRVSNEDLISLRDGLHAIRNALPGRMGYENTPGRGS
ncbi:MAG: MarR family transcriptional regulator [Spirochaetia bacterium]|jgi:DNA-binding MarR family transcriptional regulator